MNALEIGLRASVIVLVALAATAALSRRSAALRHWVLAAGILSAAAVAPLSLALPAWDLPASATAADASTLAAGGVGEAAVKATTSSTVARQPAAFAPISYERMVNATWAAGFVVSILVMLASLVRLRGVTRRAVPVVDERWLAAARDLSSSLDVRDAVVLLQTGLPAMLGTWGWWRPQVLLPAQCESWSDARVRIVLGTNWRTSAGPTGPCRWPRKWFARRSGTTRCFGLPAPGCGARANRLATTPCSRPASRPRSTRHTCWKSPGSAGRGFTRRPWSRWLACPRSNGGLPPC